MFTKLQHTLDAVFPRAPGSTTLPTDRLKVVYDKYKTTKTYPPGTTTINLVFMHGSGMNKLVWSFHAEELYRRSEKSLWKLDAVISVDAVGHADAAMLNKEKLGWGFDWADGSKDLVRILHHEIDANGDFIPTSYNRNIVVGHLMGGFIAMYAGFLEPLLFDSIITVEPVIYFKPMFAEIFAHRVMKMDKLLKEEFGPRSAVEHFYRKGSFYKFLDDRVLTPFMNDDVYEDNGVWRAKTPKQVEFSGYLSAGLSVPLGMQVLRLLRIPFLHVVGLAANWLPPRAVGFIRENVPKHLLHIADVEGGDHLLHCTMPDQTVDIFADFIGKRARFVEENRHKCPEVKFGNDRGAILGERWPLVTVGKTTEAFEYGTQPEGPELDVDQFSDDDDDDDDDDDEPTPKL